MISSVYTNYSLHVIVVHDYERSQIIDNKKTINKTAKENSLRRRPATEKMHNQKRKDTTTCEGSMTHNTNTKDKTAIAIVRAVGENENKI